MNQNDWIFHNRQYAKHDPRNIAARIILTGLFFLAWFLCCMIVLAMITPKAEASDWFVEGAAGETVFIPTVPDGVWQQIAFPHRFDTHDLAFALRLGRKFTDDWSATIGYLRPGQVTASGKAVWDFNYNPTTHQCLAQCDKPFTFKATDVTQGPEIAVSRAFHYGPVQPYLRGGFFAMFHDLEAQCRTFEGGDCSAHFSGMVPMLFIGAGLRYQWVGVEVNYYHGIGGSGFPVATRFVEPMLTLRIPL